MAQTSNPSSWKLESEGYRVPGHALATKKVQAQNELHVTLSQNKINTELWDSYKSFHYMNRHITGRKVCKGNSIIKGLFEETMNEDFAKLYVDIK